jgi:hypothetical protein
MSPHGDLINFGACLALFAIPAVWYYLWTRHTMMHEQLRHNRAVERASWRLYWQVRELATDDDDEAVIRGRS